MRNLMNGIAIVVASFAVVYGAEAGEDDIQLKPAAGGDTVAAYCSACHSLDYIQMDSPFLDEKGWTGVVTKMVKAFGAPIEEAEQKEIIAYLAANYGKPPS